MDDPTVNPTQNNQDNQYNQDNQVNQNEIDYNPNYLCRFCNVILYGGIDINSLMHCQNCHNVWDGNAQCRCDFYI